MQICQACNAEINGKGYVSRYKNKHFAYQACNTEINGTDSSMVFWSSTLGQSNVEIRQLQSDKFKKIVTNTSYAINV